MGIKEGALALADELEAFEDGDCEECIAYGQPECKGHLSCAEIIARYSARKVREAVERDAEDVTTVSAYDLLGDDDREALAWVREHGGLEAVKASIHQGAMEHGYLLKVAEILGTSIYDGTGNADALLDKLEKRLMPEGMEWPKVDGKPIVIGERMRSCGIDDCKVVGIDPANSRLILASDNIEEGKATYFTDFAEDCHRPMPKALDADGVEIRVGDRLYDTDTGCGRTVRAVNDNGTVEFDGHENRGWFGWFLTHRAPVLAADGEPLREGEHVYHVETGAELVVKELPNPGEYQAVVVFAPPASHPTSFDPNLLTHRAPVLAADGEPLEVGQTVWHVGNGVEFTVIGLPNPGEYQSVKLRLDDGAFTGLDPDQLTHQRPVLDADGVPIREGDTVYEVGENYPPFVVGRLPEPGAYRSVRVVYPSGAFTFLDPERLTHTKPDPTDSRQAIVNEIGDEMAARIDLLVNSGRWSDAD